MNNNEVVKADTMKHLQDPELLQLANTISGIVNKTKQGIATSVNTAIVEAYWNIGKHIVEFEQQGEVRAKYGTNLLSNSKDKEGVLALAHEGVKPSDIKLQTITQKLKTQKKQYNMLNIKYIQIGGGNSFGLKGLRPYVSYIHRAAMRVSACVAALFACVGSGAMVYFVGFNLNTL